MPRTWRGLAQQYVSGTMGTGPPPIPADRDDLKIKKYEELYKLSKEAYTGEIQRFDAAEAKVGRYLSLIVVVLGTTSVGAAEFSRLFRATSSVIGNVFLIAYFFTVVLAVGAGSFFLRALAIQVVPLLPLGSEVIDHFDRNSYLDAVYSLSREFQRAAAQVRAETNEKFRLAATGYTLFVAAIVFGVISTVTFAAVKALEGR
jgi:hypothetical protein